MVAGRFNGSQRLLNLGEKGVYSSYMRQRRWGVVGEGAAQGTDVVPHVDANLGAAVLVDVALLRSCSGKTARTFAHSRPLMPSTGTPDRTWRR